MDTYTIKVTDFIRQFKSVIDENDPPYTITVKNLNNDVIDEAAKIYWGKDTINFISSEKELYSHVERIECGNIIKMIDYIPIIPDEKQNDILQFLKRDVNELYPYGFNFLLLLLCILDMQSFVIYTKRLYTNVYNKDKKDKNIEIEKSQINIPGFNTEERNKIWDKINTIMSIKIRK